MAPPQRMRLEILPPVGGPRLVVTADGRRLLALDPPHRRAEIWDTEGEGVARLLGAAVGAAELRTLLEGKSPCPREHASLDGSCPFGAGIYRPDPTADTAAIRGAVLLDANGTPQLFVKYPPPEPADGSWWRTIEIQRPGGRSRIRLTPASGPTPARLDPALFSTDPPEGFEPGPVLGDEGLSPPVGKAGGTP
jgi:hypothetical protein